MVKKQITKIGEERIKKWWVKGRKREIKRESLGKDWTKTLTDCCFGAHGGEIRLGQQEGLRRQHRCYGPTAREQNSLEASPALSNWSEKSTTSNTENTLRKWPAKGLIWSYWCCFFSSALAELFGEDIWSRVVWGWWYAKMGTGCIISGLDPNTSEAGTGSLGTLVHLIQCCHCHTATPLSRLWENGRVLVCADKRGAA